MCHPKAASVLQTQRYCTSRQGKRANPSLTLRAILFSYRGNSKGTLSNKKLDRHKKYLHLYFNNLSYSSFLLKVVFRVANASVLLKVRLFS